MSCNPRTVLLMVVVGLCALTAEAAYGARAPTAAEKTAILTAFGSWSDESCYAIRVSTVDERWASVTFAAARDGESVVEYSERCNPANGLAMMHLRSDGWKYETDAGTEMPACPLPGVPVEVGVDLDACLKAHVVYGTSFLYRPRTLPVSAHAVLTRLRWRNWGKETATATGVYDYADAHSKYRVRVRVRATRLGFCGERRTYRRVTIIPIEHAHRNEAIRRGNGSCP